MFHRKVLLVVAFGTFAACCPSANGQIAYPRPYGLGGPMEGRDPAERGGIPGIYVPRPALPPYVSQGMPTPGMQNPYTMPNQIVIPNLPPGYAEAMSGVPSQGRPQVGLHSQQFTPPSIAFPQQERRDNDTGLSHGAVHVAAHAFSHAPEFKVKPPIASAVSHGVESSSKGRGILGGIGAVIAAIGSAIGAMFRKSENESSTQ